MAPMRQRDAHSARAGRSELISPGKHRCRNFKQDREQNEQKN
jgi:hypothetical protein